MKKNAAGTREQGKQIRLLEGEQVHVGVDAHKRDYRVTVWSEQRQAIVAAWVQPSDPTALSRRLKPWRPPHLPVIRLSLCRPHRTVGAFL